MMGYSCKILLDSISKTNKRLTTFEITFPRIVLAEFNTHRMFSRNSASSRAIPFKKQLDRVINDPFIPERFPFDGKGMQPNEYIEGDSLGYKCCKEKWLAARDRAMFSAIEINDGFKYQDENSYHHIQIHKQICNRLLEPFMWHTVIVTATEFDNFFKLRCDENAQYEIRRIADLMYEAYHAFDDLTKIDKEDDYCLEITNKEWSAIRPQKLKVGEWHTPLIYEEDEKFIDDHISKFHGHESVVYPIYIDIKKKISVARCARISYLTHDGKRDIEKDLELYEKLVGGDPKHSSPAEHVATPCHKSITKFQYDQFRIILNDKNHSLHLETKESLQISETNNNYWLIPRIGNFYGFKQFRKEFVDENCTNFKKGN